MFGQMTAGSWIYIGTQGILQGTYQTFAAAGEQHFGSADLSGRTILTAGLGGMGGAQPLAATMAGAAILCVEVDPSRIERRLETRYHRRGRGLAGRRRSRACAPRRTRVARSRSVCSGTRRSSSRSWRRAGSTSTSSPTRPPRTIRSRATCPPRSRFEEAAALRDRDPEAYLRLARESIVAHVAGDDRVRPRRELRLRLRQQPARRGARRGRRATRSPTRASSRPTSGRCSVAGSGRSAGRRSPAILPTSPRSTAELAALFPDDALLQRWLELAPGRVAFQGLPARICWLGYGDRAKAGLAINELVRSGAVSAPVVIGRDHLDAGLGRVSVPRDRGDAGRLGRDRRLADPERARERRRGRDLGERPPRRRRRDRQLDPRGHGRRRRRHRRGSRAARARAHDRSRDGRHPPRRRGLRGGARRGARVRARPACRSVA